jgi:SEC-C motif
MEFKTKIESVLIPLIEEMREKLDSIPTLEVLNHYQLRIDAVQTDKSNVPDGFIFKWRYLWMLVLSKPFLEGKDSFEPELKQVDELIEKVFETYGIGAIYEPGRTRGSEKEFLTRLGLAIKVREPDTLAFPEQIREWASCRLQPFNDSYFLPTFGARFEEIMAWIEIAAQTLESRLNNVVQDLASIFTDSQPIQAAFVRGELDIEAARDRACELKIGERLEDNAHKGERIHIFAADELQGGISRLSLHALMQMFGIRPGEMGPEFVFPHDENPLEHKLFVVLPDGRFFFLDPANAYRIAAKTFEREILANNRHRDRYLKNRDRASEHWVAEKMKKVFAGAAIYTNYYLEKHSHEKDLIIRYGDAIILVECKNSRIRAFRGTAADLLKFENDFQNSVQYGYEQALEVKRRILGKEETAFFDKKGRPYFSVKRSEINSFYIVCVTVTPRGPFGTDLSYELKKPEEEPFPLALNLLDLDTICKHFSKPEQFIGYLQARERLHGHVRTGDELNYAGYFLKHGNLDFQDGTFVADDFSGIFDRAWFREKGIEVEEPKDPPVLTSMTRQGNRVTIEHSTGRKEVHKVPPEWVERATGKPVIRMKGSERNLPCPCGSGRKLKHCHGIE